MQTQIKNITPIDFALNSKTWIYQSNRTFTENEVKEVNHLLEKFYINWESHHQKVKGWASVVFSTFIIVMADEEASKVSGCSTDSMVRVLKNIEKLYQVDLFDRLTITFLKDEKPQPLPMSQVKYALQNGIIETDTLLFNNLVDTKFQLENEWLVPLDKSWLWARILI